MPNQQKKQEKGEAVRSTPDQQKGNVVTRVLAACVDGVVKLALPQNLAARLCPRAPVLANDDQVPTHPPPPAESSSSPLQDEENDQYQVPAENRQQKLRTLPRPSPSFPIARAGKKSIPKGKPVGKSISLKPSVSQDISTGITHTDPERATPDELLLSRAKDVMEEKEPGKFCAGSTIEMGGHQRRGSNSSSNIKPASAKMESIRVLPPPKRSASPTRVKVSALEVIDEGAKIENVPETCQKCCPICISPEELDALVVKDEKKGFSAWMKAKEHPEVEMASISSYSFKSSLEPGRSPSATMKPPTGKATEAPPMDESSRKKSSQQHDMVTMFEEMVARATDTIRTERPKLGDKAKVSNAVRDGVRRRLSEIFGEKSVTPRAWKEGEEDKRPSVLVSRAVNASIDEVMQTRGYAVGTKRNLTPSQKAELLKIINAVAEPAPVPAAAAAAAGTISRYGRGATPLPTKATDAARKGPRPAVIGLGLGIVKQMRQKQKLDDLGKGNRRGVSASEKPRTAGLAEANAAAVAPVHRASMFRDEKLAQYRGSAEEPQQQQKQQNKTERKPLAGAPNKENASIASKSGAAADTKPFAAGAAAPRFPGPSPTRASRAITPMDAVKATPTAAITATGSPTTRAVPSSSKRLEGAVRAPVVGAAHVAVNTDTACFSRAAALANPPGDVDNTKSKASTVRVGAAKISGAADETKPRNSTEIERASSGKARLPERRGLGKHVTPADAAVAVASVSSARTQHQPNVTSATQAATASSSSCGTRLQSTNESLEGWKWPTAAAAPEHNLSVKSTTSAGCSQKTPAAAREAGRDAAGGDVLKADDPPFDPFKWIGRATTPKAMLPWSSWKRKRDPEAWEKMVSAAILNFVMISQEKK